MKKELNKIDKILIIASCLAVSFAIATMIIYTIKDWQFDTLITCFLGLFGGIEPIATAGIQIAKYFKNQKKEEDPIDTHAIGFRIEDEEM